MHGETIYEGSAPVELPTPAAEEAAGSWDQALLEPIAEINEQMLESLCAAAAGGEQPLIVALRAEWRCLGALPLRRVAACPYLLLDGGFADSRRWQRLAHEGVRDGASRGYFVDASGIALVRRTLVLAWHLARSNHLAARLMLGMAPRVAALIAQHRLRELEALAELGVNWIVPRWEHQPQVWRQLLAAARRDSPLALRVAQLRGLQLLAASALPSAP